MKSENFDIEIRNEGSSEHLKEVIYAILRERGTKVKIDETSNQDNRDKGDDCCQTKYGRHCGGECTCAICAPDLHKRELEPVIEWLCVCGYTNHNVLDDKNECYKCGRLRKPRALWTKKANSRGWMGARNQFDLGD